MSVPVVDSPIKWVGGKSKLRGEVLRRLPTDAECYVEVFAGAAWVLFAKQPHAVEVLNDKNDDLVNLWRVLKWRTAELLENVHNNLYSRTMFYELRSTEPPAYDEMSRAVRTYLLIQMAFGSDISRTQSASFGFRNKSRGDLFLNKSLGQVFPAADRLRNVFVECLDFADVIRRYDQPLSIFFCDPPYLGTCGYAEGFTATDHCRLAHELRTIEGRFLLTINDTPEVREIYCGYRFEETTEARAKARASEGRQKAAILFVSNFEPEQANLFAQEPTT